MFITYQLKNNLTDFGVNFRYFGLAYQKSLKCSYNHVRKYTIGIGRYYMFDSPQTASRTNQFTKRPTPTPIQYCHIVPYFLFIYFFLRTKSDYTTIYNSRQCYNHSRIIIVTIYIQQLRHDRRN